MNNSFTISQLGWQQYFQQQLDLNELENLHVARVCAQHKSQYQLQLENKLVSLTITPSMPIMTVGDWLLLDENDVFIRLLERKSKLVRKAPGSKVAEQLIAVNIDTLFIVCSLNDDFNLNRIERYLTIAHEAEIEPVVVLTKRDQCSHWSELVSQVQALDPLLAVEAVNALEPEQTSVLKHWCSMGKTVSFMGSSGVGKSTLVNTLMGTSVQQTAGIREDDSKGRHTTTARSMHFMPSGCVLLDTPGMRELQLTDCADGLKHTFAEIEELELQCRFANCSHNQEPGCAITKALEEGSLETRRWNNFLKLKSEQSRNSASLKQKRDKDKALSKMYRSVQTGARQQKKGY